MIKGPAIFLAQFLDDDPPFDSLENITAWAKSLGYKGVQVPADAAHIIDLDKAAESKTYCDELVGRCGGLEITELATHIFGQLMAVHPAHDALFDGFADPSVRGNPKARYEWAVDRMKKAIIASRNLDKDVTVSFTGALLWHYLYPWPARPQGLVEQCFQELARLWKPVLDTAEEYGVYLAYEIHPGEDLHDGVTFERFREAAGNHERITINYDPSHFVLQCLDYVGFISVYSEFIKAFHVKDAEFNPSPRSGVYGGYQGWTERPGRFRSIGDGQVDFKKVFTGLTEAGYDSWAVVEWECCVKDAAQGAAEAAPIVSSLLIETPKKSFDDFAAGDQDPATNRKILGME